MMARSGWPCRYVICYGTAAIISANGQAAKPNLYTDGTPSINGYVLPGSIARTYTTVDGCYLLVSCIAADSDANAAAVSPEVGATLFDVDGKAPLLALSANPPFVEGNNVDALASVGAIEASKVLPNGLISSLLANYTLTFIKYYLVSL